MNNIDYFDIWLSDKKSMLDTMVKNMASDLECGYDYFGKSIQFQLATINKYKSKYDTDMKWLAMMDEKQANRWCYMDMLRRGVIE